MNEFKFTLGSGLDCNLIPDRPLLGGLILIPSCLVRELLRFEIWQEHGSGEGEEAAGNDREDERDDEGVVRLGRDVAETGVGDGGDVDGARGEEHEAGGGVKHQKEAATHL